MLNGFSFGEKIDFEHELVQWQARQDLTTNKSTTGSSNTVSSYISNLTMSVSISLDELLSHDTQGQMLKTLYDKNNEFNEANRRLLVDIIVDYFLKNKIPFTTDDCESISTEIVELFPNEEQVINSKCRALFPD